MFSVLHLRFLSKSFFYYPKFSFSFDKRFSRNLIFASSKKSLPKTVLRLLQKVFQFFFLRYQWWNFCYFYLLNSNNFFAYLHVLSTFSTDILSLFKTKWSLKWIVSDAGVDYKLFTNEFLRSFSCKFLNFMLWTIGIFYSFLDSFKHSVAVTPCCQ